MSEVGELDNTDDTRDLVKQVDTQQVDITETPSGIPLSNNVTNDNEKEVDGQPSDGTKPQTDLTTSSDINSAAIQQVNAIPHGNEEGPRTEMPSSNGTKNDEQQASNEMSTASGSQDTSEGVDSLNIDTSSDVKQDLSKAPGVTESQTNILSLNSDTKEIVTESLMDTSLNGSTNDDVVHSSSKSYDVNDSEAKTKEEMMSSSNEQTLTEPSSYSDEEDYVLVSEAEMLLQEERLKICTESLEDSRKQYENWSDRILRRRMFALTRLRKLQKAKKERMRFYDDVLHMFAADGSSVGSTSVSSNS